MMSKLLLVVLIAILVSSVTITIPVSAQTSTLTKNTRNDNPTTARFGNTVVCGDHICGPGEFAKLQEKLNNAQRGAQAGRQIPSTPSTPQGGQNMSQPITQTPPAPTLTTPTPPTPQTPPTPIPSTPSTPQGGQNMSQTAPSVSSMWTTKTGTLTSVQDPGQGHETHQLAIVLPPSNKIYSGIISWTSSEPMQIVELTGPIESGDDKGQPIWTTDGKTKFALTLIDVNKTTGSFAFTGNALAFHFSQPTKFTVSYAISYMESSSSDTVKFGTLTSVQDPGQGHETHQLALILPPSSNAYHGILTYSASEPVQLVSLIGPIDPKDNHGQLVYTMDGKTWYALVFVDPGMQMGTWKFVGNALAIHTKNTTPFHVSYTVDAHN